MTYSAAGASGAGITAVAAEQNEASFLEQPQVEPALRPQAYGRSDGRRRDRFVILDPWLVGGQSSRAVTSSTATQWTTLFCVRDARSLARIGRADAASPRPSVAPAARAAGRLRPSPTVGTHAESSRADGTSGARVDRRPDRPCLAGPHGRLGSYRHAFRRRQPYAEQNISNSTRSVRSRKLPHGDRRRSDSGRSDRGSARPASAASSSATSCGDRAAESGRSRPEGPGCRGARGARSGSAPAPEGPR